MNNNLYSHQTFNTLPEMICCSIFENCKFNATATFDRCNIEKCTFTEPCTFNFSNLTDCEFADDSVFFKSNIIDSEEEARREAEMMAGVDEE